jgi:hypothetical protein
MKENNIVEKGREGGGDLKRTKEICYVAWVRVRVIVFNAIFSNISAIWWRSDLLVEEITELSQGTDTLYHKILYRVHLACARFTLHGNVLLNKIF